MSEIRQINVTHLMFLQSPVLLYDAFEEKN